MTVLFWIVALIIALVASLVSDGSFGEYLVFVSLILLGIALLVSAPLANRLTAIETRVWTGTSYRGEARPDAGGVTPLGSLILLAPQIAIVALLFG